MSELATDLQHIEADTPKGAETALQSKGAGMDNHAAPNKFQVCKPSAILAEKTPRLPQDATYRQHGVIARFGSPQQPVYIDPQGGEISGQNYTQPLILPLYDGLSPDRIGLAYLEDEKPVICEPDKTANGYACLNLEVLDPSKPVLLTADLEAFFVLTAAGLPVVLVVLQSLCHKTRKPLKQFEANQVAKVVRQLTKAGFNQVFMPLEPRDYNQAEYAQLEQTTALKRINMVQMLDGAEVQLTLDQIEDKNDLADFINKVLALQNPVKQPPKGHLAMPWPYDGGVFELLPSGLYFNRTDKEGQPQPERISSPIKVLAQTRNDNSENWGVLLEWTDRANRTHRLAIPAQLFQTDGAELRKILADRGVEIEGKHARRVMLQNYLMSYNPDRLALCVDRVGWHDNLYVLPQTQYGKSEQSDFVVYQSSHKVNDPYKQAGTLQQWREQVAQPCKTHNYLVMALSMAFAGQLLDPLDIQGGGFHFKGGTSKGKSTAMNLAASVWGKSRDFVRTWRTTDNATESTAEIHNDSLLALDEIGEMTDPRKLGQMVYMLANGEGKNRMSKDISARPVSKWRLMLLSNGEKSLKEMMSEAGQKTMLGQEIRFIDIDINQSPFGVFDSIDFAADAPSQADNLKQAISAQYGTAGIAWLEHLTQSKPQRISEAKALLKTYQQQLKHGVTDGHIQRVADRFAVVAVAGEMATRAGITGWPQGTAIAAVLSVYRVWLGSFEYKGDYLQRELLEAVKAFFDAHGSSRFECWTPDPQNPERINNRVGYWRIDGNSKKYYVSRELFKSEICKGHDPQAATKALRSVNWIECDNEGKPKKVTLPSGVRERVYVFNEQCMLLDDNATQAAL